jgi:hypothetical protein
METAQLCDICQKEQIWDHLTGERKPGSVKDFPLDNRQARQNCPFCKLLYGILAVSCDPSSKISLQGTTCQLKTLPGLAAGINVAFRDHSGMRIRVEKRSYFENATGSAIPYDAGSPQMDLGRLRRILTTCLRDHERCQFKPLSGMSRKKSNILLIDVHQHCLVEQAYNCDRVALSYVWGKD